MATKPTVASPPFPTSATYTAGARIGDPTKIAIPDAINGYTPGVTIEPESFNFYMSELLGWQSNWVALGSALASLDAHIIETDALGYTAIAAAKFGNTGSAFFALEVASNASATAQALLVTNNHAGIAGLFNNLGAASTIKAQNSGGGYSVEANALGTGGGVKAKSIGAGDAMNAEATGAGHAVYARATGTGMGGYFERKPAGGPAGSFQQDGAGAPARGIVNLEPTSPPTAPVVGDVYLDPGTAGFGRGGFLHYDADGAGGGGGAGFQRHWTTENGIGVAYDSSEGDTTEAAGVLTTKLTLSLDASGSPGNGQGVYMVTYSCEIELAAGAALTTRCYVEFHDDTGAINVTNIDFAAVGAPKTITAMRYVTLAAGIIPLEIKFKTTAAPDGVTIRRARIFAQGAYE